MQHERRAVGLLAPAVAVAVDVAVDVEQRLRARDVVAAVVGAQRRIEAVGSRRHRRLRRDRLAAPDDPDLVVDVVRELDRAAQRDLRRRVAADHRVFHVEVRHGDVGVQVALQADALLGEVGRELAVRRGDRRQLGRDAREVGLAVEEAQPARLVLLDDGDLDAVVERQAPAVEALGPGLSPRHRPRIGLALIAHVAVGRVLLEDDARAAAPRLEAIRPGADRVRHQVVAIGLDDLARDRRVRARGERRREARARLGELELQRVAVERAQAFGDAVVVERLLVAQRTRPDLLETEDALLGERGVRRALERRVVDALERVHVVGGDELARLALERRVVGEADAALQAHRPDREVGRRPRGIASAVSGTSRTGIASGS